MEPHKTPATPPSNIGGCGSLTPNDGTPGPGRVLLIDAPDLVRGLGFDVEGFGFWVLDLGFKVQGLGFGVLFVVFRVQGSGFGV